MCFVHIFEKEKVELEKALVIVFPLDLVDIKVCSVSKVWSGLKVVIRKNKRK